MSLKSDCVWPAFDDEMVEAATRVLRSGRVNYWTGGEGQAFEAEMAGSLGLPYTLAVSNGTCALEMALRALGVRAGDEVVTTPRSFIASASCAVACGARPVFADVDPDSGNVTAETIEAVLTRRTRAIVAVHLGGWPCDLEPILSLAERTSIKVVEDVAQALGGKYHGRALGSWGDISAFSFCTDKIVTTAGEGGLIATANEELFKSAWSQRDHGRDWDATWNAADTPGYKWVRNSLGSNYRMTEIQAAIGRVGLRRLPGWLAARRRNAEILTMEFSNLPALRVPTAPEGHAYYTLYVYVRPERLNDGWTRDRLLTNLLRANVQCNAGVCPELYRERAFDLEGSRPAAVLPIARELGEVSLAFAVHPLLTEQDMHETADRVRRIFAAATR
jgi:dTDP-4-amino-4,6-dideoxygalactose transaminase